MKALVLTSDSPRHAYFTQTISRNFDLVGCIRESKGNYYSNQISNSNLIKSHFHNLISAEHKFFGSSQWPPTCYKNIYKSQINLQEVISWAKSFDPLIIFLFGTSILSDDWLNAFPNRVINLHLGLSPFYRGSATLFWPIANNEIECVGSTIHLAAKLVDSGKIISRVKPNLAVGDDYYTINYKAIQAAVNAVPDVSIKYISGLLQPFEQSLDEGHVYKKADFSELYLRRALENIGSGLTLQQVSSIIHSKKCNCSL